VKELSATDWEARYQEKNTPWDLQEATPEFVRLANEGWFPKKGKALVPGGGRGYDAIHLAKLGLEVDLVDFAPSALTAALELAAQEKATVYAYRANFFDLPKIGYHQKSYDVILEYTFFCAIDPSLREKYVESVTKLLKPKGLLVALFFPTLTDKEGPPFLVSKEEVEKLFAPYFEMEFHQAMVSVNPRKDREFLGIFRLKN
jgi:SAM-dependent methyltransferase